jgi:hypothetical protein
MRDQQGITDSLAYRRGQVDFLANAPTPYPRESMAFRAWLAGWQNSLQRKNKSHVIAIRMPRT